MIQLPKLRDYQLDAIQQLRNGIKAGHRAQLLVLPTGAGKTTVAAQLIHGAVQQANHVLFMAHRKELVTQAKDRLHTFGLRPGIIMAGYQYKRHMMVNVASQQTLIRRELPVARVIVVDEAHHSVSKGFKTLLQQYPDAVIIGLTATPYRLDGKGLGDLYSNIVAPISLAELTDMGYLVPARYVGSKMDMTGMKTTGGDYNLHELHLKFDKREVYDGVLDNYHRFAPGTKAIVFNVDVKHSQTMRDRFLEAGITCAHVDGETPAMERANILDDFKHGRYQVLCNVNILTEGYDLPDIETVILNRATKSKSLYLQMVGRGLRPAPGKAKCTVIDQGGNVWEHGPVEQPEEYSLDPSKKKKKGQGAAPVKACPTCFFLQHLSAPTCKECGHVFTVHISERSLKKAEFSELTNILAATVKASLPEHLRKSYLDMTKEELKEVAAIRGYKQGWVFVQLKRQTEQAA